MEDKFEQLFELKEDENITNNITITINKKITMLIVRILLVILIVCLTISGICMGMYTIERNKYYDPFKEEGIAELYNEKTSFSTGKTYEDLSKEGKENVQMQYYDYLMATYYSVFVPGTYYEGSSSIEYVGEGNYTVYGGMHNGFGNNISYTYEPYGIVKSRNTSDIFTSRFIFTCHESEDVCYDQIGVNWEEKGKIEMLEEVMSMPDSSVFMAYVSYKNAIPLSKWDYSAIPNYDYKYALTGYAKNNRYVGFTMDDFSGVHPFGAIAEEVYGNYWATFEDANGEEFYKHLKTRLSILAEHEEFANTFGGEDGSTMKAIQQMLEKVEKKEVEVKGYMAHVSKEEMLEILKDDNTAYITIEDVHYSMYEK